MLQAEVTALKTLVLTSTPASPNRELHPQLLSPTKAGPRKGHLRHKSTSSTLCPAVCPAAGHTLTPDKEGKEVRGGGRAVVDAGQGDKSPRQWGPVERPDPSQCDLEPGLPSLGLCVLWEGWAGFCDRRFGPRPLGVPRGGPDRPSKPL